MNVGIFTMLPQILFFIMHLSNQNIFLDIDIQAKLYNCPVTGIR